MARLKRRVGEGAYTLPMFAPKSTWRAPELGALPSWREAKRIALDVETKDPTLTTLGPGVRRGGYITGYSFGIEGGPKHYIPMRHEGGDNVPDAGAALRYLQDQMKIFRGEIVGANLGYDLDYLMEEDVDFSNVTRFRDVQIAEPIIDELQDRFSLDVLGKKYVGEGKNDELLRQAAIDYGFDPKKEMWRLPARFVGEYAEDDCDLPLRVLRKQEEILAREKLDKIWELESRVLPVLVKMRRRGVRIDFDHLDKVEKWCLREERAAADEVLRHSGVDIGIGNVWQAEVLAVPLRKMGHELPVNVSKAGKISPSVKADWLKEVGKKCPVARAIGRARKVNKVRTTFAASVRTHSVRGRVHCTFNQLRKNSDDGSGGSESEETEGAAFGRLSCVDPNLQQQPARDPELGPMWRAVYIADEGKIWCANDYSQQEPRWAVSYAERLTPEMYSMEGKLCTMHQARLTVQAAQEAAQKYRDDPSTDNHQMMADMAGVKRKDAKEIYLGLTYGMGGAKLCRKLGLATKWIDTKRRGKIEVAGDEGQALLDRFDGKVPFLKLLAKRLAQDAERRGWILTEGGRKCHFPEKPGGGGYDWTHKALNRLIQGVSGDQTKTALVHLDQEGYYIQLQVHDEIDGSVENEEEAAAMAQVMVDALPSTVPSKVDTELGASWGASMGWKGWPEEISQ